jgi:hypothetical protein
MGNLQFDPQSFQELAYSHQQSVGLGWLPNHHVWPHEDFFATAEPAGRVEAAT